MYFLYVQGNLWGISFLSACLPSWENDFWNGPSGSFPQHFLLLGMIRVGLFFTVTEEKKKKIISLWSLLCVWERQKSQQKEKRLLKTTRRGSPAVVSRSGEVVGAFFSSQFFLSGFLWDNKHAHFWHRHCCCCRKHNCPADPGVEGGELRSRPFYKSNGLF